MWTVRLHLKGMAVEMFSIFLCKKSVRKKKSLLLSEALCLMLHETCWLICHFDSLGK